MKKGLGWLKKPQGTLALALILILIGSFLAGMFNTAFNATDVSEIEFATERGTLNGLLYMPKGAGANDPRPVIVTTHGYLNTKEMQDAPAIEMSRRGYIVLALDMYDHGDSRWDADIPAGSQFGTFWIYSQFDAAAYMYQQPYTLKDDAGNAYIAVSGHSMGGFSSFVAMYMDEMASLQTGYRMIYAGIPAGADLSYAAAIAPPDQMQAAFGSRTVGVVAAHYDEFFFNKSGDEKTEAEQASKGSVRYKDYAATNAGKALLGLAADAPAGEAGVYYTAESGDLTVDGNVVRASEAGERVIFTPSQTHPWNHFSRVATSNLISFYQHAFAGITPATQTMADLQPDNQIWQWKEFWSFVSLIGFFLLFLPLCQILIRLPLLKKAVTAEVEPVPGAKCAWGKLVTWIGIAAGALIPAIFFADFMDKSATLKTLGYVALGILAIGVIAAIFGFATAGKDEGEKKTKRRGYAFGGVAVAIVSLLLFLVFQFASDIVKLGAIFNEPTVNQVAYWALVSGLVTALITLAFYFFMKRPAGVPFANYGVGVNWLSVLMSLVTAVTAVALGYAVLFVTQGFFGVDYRVWTLAVRTFKIEHVWTALRYMPIFFVYYLCNTTAINANARARKHGTLLAVLMNIGGLVLWIGYQYGKLFVTGVAAFPTQALNAILLFALIPCLALAGVFARKLTLRTNNVWLGAFLNTILFTMITAANTAMFWNMI